MTLTLTEYILYVISNAVKYVKYVLCLGNQDFVRSRTAYGHKTGKSGCII